MSGQKNILLVEDDALIALSEKAALQKYGHAVQIASTGEKAVESVKASTLIDLILMDINLGRGIDGTEAAEIILKDHDIPIIFVSSHSEREIVEKTERITSYGYVLKSSSITVLDASIKVAFKLFEEKMAGKEKEKASRESEERLKSIIAVSDTGATERDANEEYEALNEKLRTSMEELKVANEELLASNERLLANDEMRERTERKLRDSELKYRSLVEYSSNIVFCVDRNGEYQFVNSAMASLFGKTPGFFVGKTFWDVFPREDADNRYEIVRKVFASGEMESFEIAAPVRDRMLHFSSTANPVKDESGNVLLVLTHGTDITERKHAEDLLKREQNRLQNVLTGTRTGTWEWNMQTGEASFDKESAAILGFSLDELQPHNFETWMRLKHPDDMNEANGLLMEHARGESESYSFESRMRHKNGSWVWVHGRGKVVEWDTEQRPLWMFGTHMDVTERKRVEEALRSAEEMYRNLFLNAQIGIFRTEIATGLILDANDAVARFIGFADRKELLSTRFTIAERYANHHERERMTSLLKKHGEVSNFETQFIRNDGSIIWMRFSARTVPEKGWMEGISEDITESKRVEEALRDSERQFRFAMDATNDGLWDWDIPSGKVYYSPGYFRMLGYEPTELGSHFDAWQELIHPRDLRQVMADNEACLNNLCQSIHVEYRMKAKDGTWRWILGRGKAVERDPAGQALRMIGTHVDITERKRIEEELRQSNELFRQYLTHSPIYCFIHEVTRTRSITLSCSDNYDEMLGIPSSTILGKSMDEVFPPELARKITDDDWDVITRHVVLTMDEELNGRTYTTTKYPIVQGDRTLLAGYSIDITEKRKAEEKIRSLLAEKELILKEVHHRIKNNMGTMVSLLSLQADNMKEPIAIDALKDAENRLRSMAVLYDRLNQTSNFMEISVKDYLPSLVDEVVRVFPNSEKVSVETRIDDFNIGVRELSSLGIIVNEILTNAMKYAFVHREKGAISISASKKGSMATIRISDNGVGLPEHMNIESSSGFGMLMIGTLTRQLNGTILIERKNGTTYILEFAMGEKGR